jgi:hypothetical protein
MFRALRIETTFVYLSKAKDPVNIETFVVNHYNTFIFVEMSYPYHLYDSGFKVM